MRREGKVHAITFSEGGEKVSELEVVGNCGRQAGTRVRVWPDPKYFDTAKVPQNEMERLLRSKAVLLPGVAVMLEVEQADGSMLAKTWRYPDGLAGYLAELAAGQDRIALAEALRRAFSLDR